MMQRLTAITHHRFSLFRFRSPLLTESLHYFLFLRVLRCFHFPAFPPNQPIHSAGGSSHEDEPGFPIRKSSDHSPVIGSRGLSQIHVLHRLLMPRHPPCALNNLHTIKKNKNLKSTIKPTQSIDSTQIPEDARVHYIVLKQQPTTQQQHKNNLLHHHHAGQTKEQHTCVTPKPNNAPHPTQNQYSTHEQNHPPDTRG